MYLRPSEFEREPPYDIYPGYFARKLIRPFGATTREDIETEVKAITRLCASGEHEHIIRFFSHGPLPSGDYYYIDMEFCECNLERYIYSPDRSDLLSSFSLRGAPPGRPAFCRQWNSAREQRENV